MFATASFPRCGHCGYNLTAAESNRCPECGLLFIEAGVLAPRRRQRRLVVKVVLGVAAFLLFPAMIGGAMTLHYRAQAAAAQARARAAQALAAAQLATAQANAQLLEQSANAAAAQAAQAQLQAAGVQSEYAERIEEQKLLQSQIERLLYIEEQRLRQIQPPLSPMSSVGDANRAGSDSRLDRELESPNPP